MKTENQAKEKLAKLAVTGCFNNTFYTVAEDQLKDVLDLTSVVNPEFVAKLAVYSRERGFMKDMPAALCAQLARKNPALLRTIFPRVIDNGKMVRNFVQMLRGGAFGSKSMGTAPRNLVRTWFESKSDRDLFFSSVGGTMSMGDIVALAHPSPATRSRAAMYAYFRGKKKCRFGGEEFEVQNSLPDEMQAYEAFKATGEGDLPAAPMEMLEGLTLSDEIWKEIARKATWSQTRQGLNKFARHGIFKDADLTNLIVERLRNPELIRKSRVFPYQLMSAYLATESTDLPTAVKKALEAAMEVSVENVPVFDGEVYVFPDVSGSMSSASVTGTRKGATSTVKAIQVAGLLTACILRRNPQAKVMPFDGDVRPVTLDPKGSILENAKILGRMQGGSTNCRAPLARINQLGAKMDLGIYVSDNESNVGEPVAGGDNYRSYGRGATSGTLIEFDQLKQRSPEAKLVCIDTSVETSLLVPTREDVLNIGGFSDAVFDIMGQFANSKTGTNWVEVIEQTKI